MPTIAIFAVIAIVLTLTAPEKNQEKPKSDAPRPSGKDSQDAMMLALMDAYLKRNGQ